MGFIASSQSVSHLVSLQLQLQLQLHAPTPLFAGSVLLINVPLNRTTSKQSGMNE